MTHRQVAAAGEALRTVDGRAGVDLPGFVARQLQLADGGTLGFVQGPANGPALVLLPGVLDPWHGYAASAEELGGRFEVFMVSLRGHAPSSAAANGRYRVCDYGEDIAALIAQAMRPPAFVAGNSLGGLIALWLASRRPELVQAICLEDAPLFVTEPPRWNSHWMRPAFAHLVGAIEAHAASGGQPSTLVDRIAGMPIVRPRLHAERADRQATMALIHTRFGFEGAPELPHTLAPGWHSYVEHAQQPAFAAFYPREVAEQLAQQVGVVDVRAPRAVLDGQLNEGFPHAQALGQVRCAMLVMEADRLLSGIVDSADHARACSLTGAAARHVYAAGAGHQIHVDSPLWFARELAAFCLEDTLASPGAERRNVRDTSRLSG